MKIKYMMHDCDGQLTGPGTPMFVLSDTAQTSSFVVQTWTCNGCLRSVVIGLKEQE